MSSNREGRGKSMHHLLKCKGFTQTGRDDERGMITGRKGDTGETNVVTEC